MQTWVPGELLHVPQTHDQQEDAVSKALLNVCRSESSNKPSSVLHFHSNNVYINNTNHVLQLIFTDLTIVMFC